MRRIVLAILAFACAAGAKPSPWNRCSRRLSLRNLIACAGRRPRSRGCSTSAARATSGWPRRPDLKGVRAHLLHAGRRAGRRPAPLDARTANRVIYVRGGDLEFLGRPGPEPGDGSRPASSRPSGWPPRVKRRARSRSGTRRRFRRRAIGMAYFLLGGQILERRSRRNACALAADPRARRRHGGRVRWSPDGTKLAFVSDRANHSFIAVYDFAAKSLNYLDPSVDRDRNPVWSPDGRQLRSSRTLRAVAGGRGAHREGDPWAIRVASVAGGAGRQVWKAEHGHRAASSTRWSRRINSTGARAIASSFPWERDGWRICIRWPWRAARPLC